MIKNSALTRRLPTRNQPFVGPQLQTLQNVLLHQTNLRTRWTMAVTDFFAGEIVTELLKQLWQISQKSCLCRSTADSLISRLKQLEPVIQEIKYTGVELPAFRQFQLDRFSELLREGTELATKVLNSARWNVYNNVRYARKLERFEKRVVAFIQGPLQLNLLADVHHLRFDTTERFDRLEQSNERIEKWLGSLKIGARPAVGGAEWMEEALRRAEEEDQALNVDGSLVNLGLELGKKKLKEMVIGRDDLGVVGISGIGGSGKTTLARELCRDDEIKSHFKDRILFLTVSQSPNVEQLRSRIWGFLMGNENLRPSYVVPEWNLQCPWQTSVRNLVVLDDVWSLQVLERLIFKIPGCQTLVVSRFKFPTVLKSTYEVELLREHEALALFCHSAFGQKFIPPAASENLVKQIVNECKGLPLALKVIGASLRDQPEMYWASAKNRLSKGETICESHENHLLERMAISVTCLEEKVRECFMDLGAFPEDRKIPIDILINMWVELHVGDEQEAFAILIELANKNLLTLVKDARGGDLYTGYYDVAVTQHDVLRDLALYLSNRGNINDRKRLLMPRRETGLPKEWERNSDQPFNARIISIHTGEMNEMDWFPMEFPKAEALILNFSSAEYFFPPFMEHMPKLKTLVIINYHSANASLRNLPEFSGSKLRSLWLEKVVLPQLSTSTVPLPSLKKLSLVLCKINSSLDPSVVDLHQIFPALLELTIDHCDDLFELPSSICRMRLLKSMSITNCHNLYKLPADLGMLRSLHILRLYACPELKELPLGICELLGLKYLDISQCVKLSRLPQGIDRLSSLEKIDMRECSRFRTIPKFSASLQSLRQVICDDEISWLWEDAKRVLPNLHIQVAEKYFSLDWLNE